MQIPRSFVILMIAPLVLPWAAERALAQPNPQARPVRETRGLEELNEQLRRSIDDSPERADRPRVRVRNDDSSGDRERLTVWRPERAGTWTRMEVRDEHVDLSTDEMLVVRPERLPPIPLRGEAITLPARGLFATLEQGRLRKHSVQLDIHAKTSPLRWNADDEAYSVDLLIACLEEGEETGSGVQLPGGIELRFLTEGCGTVDPDRLVITRTGLAAGELHFTCNDHRSLPKIIAISKAWGRYECSLMIEPALAQLELSLHKTSALGWGAETVDLTIERFADDGNPWAAPEELVVRLEGNTGIYPARVTIPANNSSTLAQLRSAGLDDIGLTAVAGTIRSFESKLVIRFPWLLLLLAAGFGALGGLFRAWQSSNLEGGPAQRRRKIVNRTLFGALTGFLLVALVALGLDLTEIDARQVLSELGTSVVGALGGWSGAAVFSVVSGKLVREEPAPG